MPKPVKVFHVLETRPPGYPKSTMGLVNQTTKEIKRLKMDHHTFNVRNSLCMVRQKGDTADMDYNVVGVVFDREKKKPQVGFGLEG